MLCSHLVSNGKRLEDTCLSPHLVLYPSVLVKAISILYLGGLAPNKHLLGMDEFGHLLNRGKSLLYEQEYLAWAFFKMRERSRGKRSLSMNRYGNTYYNKGVVRFCISQRQCSKRSSRETYHRIERRRHIRMSWCFFLRKVCRKRAPPWAQNFTEKGEIKWLLGRQGGREGSFNRWLKSLRNQGIGAVSCLLTFNCDSLK